MRGALDKENWPTAENLDYVILTPEGGQDSTRVFPSLPIHSNLLISSAELFLFYYYLVCFVFFFSSTDYAFPNQP